MGLLVMRKSMVATVGLLRATLFSVIITTIACWMHDWETVGAGVLLALVAMPAGIVYVIVEMVRPEARFLKHGGFLLTWILLLAFVVAGFSSPEGSEMASFVGKAVLIATLCMNYSLTFGPSASPTR